MTMEITFPGGLAVQAEFKGHTLLTDQPVKAGGGGQALSPFDLFLTSIGTCAGFFALRFCQERDLATEGLRVSLEAERDPETRRVGRIAIQVYLPADFPDKYRKALLRAVDQCPVKRHIVEPPEFEVAIAD